LREDSLDSVASQWRDPAAIDQYVAAPGLSSVDPAGSILARVLELLGPSPISVNELVRLAEAPIQDVRVILLELELAGKFEYSGGERVSLVAPKARD
jgi:DNA processing protein